jgi:YggT family protein
MFVVANFLVAIARVLDIAINVFIWLIVIRAIVSWISVDPFNPIVQFLNKSTDPVLFPLRKVLPFSLKWGIDITPVIAVLILIFAQSFVVKTIVDVAGRLRISG